MLKHVQVGLNGLPGSRGACLQLGSFLDSRDMGRDGWIQHQQGVTAQLSKVLQCLQARTRGGLQFMGRGNGGEHVRVQRTWAACM